MARPIAPTPVLYGMDAVRFEERIANPVHLTTEERRAQREAYEFVKSRATFPML